MKVIDRTKVMKKYKGLWVAFHHDQETVLASAKTLKEVLELAHASGYPNPIVAKMAERIVPMIGAFPILS
jgi:hypothetical protein